MKTKHGHHHAHHHPHDHAHEHPHPHPHPEKRGRSGGAAIPRARREAEGHRQPLSRGAGRGQTLFLDCASGIAGDMTIGALVDLGVPFEVVEEAIFALPLRSATLVLEAAHAGAIGATRFDVRVAKGEPERHYSDIDAMLVRAKLPERVKTLSRAIFRRLGEAEAEVHRIALSEVHFHEVGAVDSIVDIVGSAACFEFLGASVVASPLPLGKGFVECRHGTLPLPAPATVACLRGVPTYDAGIDAELVTPTGAAIVATVAARFERWPSIEPSRIGWGAGTRVLPDRPNALRAVLGKGASVGRDAASATHVVVEANLDDATGELLGHAIAALLAEGALDAWASPVTMKKGRPGVVLSALARASDAARIAEAVLRETSSIGVRITEVNRVERPRHEHYVRTRFGEIPVKTSEGPYGAPVVKPEFDACAAIAARERVPVRVVLAEALRAATETAPAEEPQKTKTKKVRKRGAKA